MFRLRCSVLQRMFVLALLALLLAGCAIIPVPTRSARDAVTALTQDQIDVVLLTSSVQIHHLLKIAEEMHLRDQLLRALSRTVVASIGPVTSETLRALGINAIGRHIFLCCDQRKPKCSTLEHSEWKGTHT